MTVALFKVEPPLFGLHDFTFDLDCGDTEASLIRQREDARANCYTTHTFALHATYTTGAEAMAELERLHGYALVINMEPEPKPKADLSWGNYERWKVS